MVSLASLDFKEMGRCLLAGCAGGAAAWFVAWSLHAGLCHLPSLTDLHHARSIADAMILIAGTAAWTAIAAWILEISGSALPSVAKRRLRFS
jgi:putative peptidoglycan lipid II flippase